MRKIITTIGPGNWELYGKRFAESFKKFWPTDIQLEIYHHQLGGAVPECPGVVFKALDDLPAFKTIAAALPGANNGPGLGYAFKAIALADAVTPELDWIGFIDADTETMRPVTDRLLDKLFDSNYDLTYLYRRSAQESEGSWFAFNLTTPIGASLLADFWGLYNSLQAFKLTKAHDNAVLDHIVMIHRAHGLRVKNLSEGALGLDSFHQSPLGEFLVHYKGPDKGTVANPGLGVPSRYDLLCEAVKWVAQNEPAVKAAQQMTLVEVGTWNGSRAVHMADTIFSAGPVAVHYIGFDTFEEGNDRAVEGHTKEHADRTQVAGRLENYAAVMARHGKTFTFELIGGNSTKTLPATPLPDNIAFAYIDGGHSYDTVASDYANLMHVPYVVFDDIIEKPEDGAPDGPRRVFENAQGAKTLLNTNDAYVGLKQTISLGIVTKKGYAPPQMRQQLIVKPRDSVDKTEQFDFIRENTKRMKTWLAPYQAHERTAILVSAGPTLKKFTREIKEKQAAGAVVFAVKHAYPELKKAGIRPDFTVLLDPRPVNKKSTHGIVRSDLFKSVKAGEKFLMATMTHPSVHNLLAEKNAEIIGWHAHTQGTQDAKLPELSTGIVVGGGTCAATRMPMLAFIMGFRRFDFYGYDFFYEEDTNPKDVKQQLMRIMVGRDSNSKEFLTTGELVAAMQDLGVWNKWMVDNRLSVVFHGEGAGATIWKTTILDYKPPAEYPY